MTFGDSGCVRSEDRDFNPGRCAHHCPSRDERATEQILGKTECHLRVWPKADAAPLAQVNRSCTYWRGFNAAMIEDSDANNGCCSIKGDLLGLRQLASQSGVRLRHHRSC